MCRASYARMELRIDCPVHGARRLYPDILSMKSIPAESQPWEPRRFWDLLDRTQGSEDVDSVDGCSRILVAPMCSPTPALACVAL